MKTTQKSKQTPEKDRERGIQLRRGTRAGRRMIVALMVPIVITVREVDTVHVGRVVPVLLRRKLPMGIVRAETTL